MYDWSCNIIRCRRFCIANNFFLNIVSRGLWSDYALICLPYTYWWKCVAPNTIDNSYFSIIAYYCSVSVNDREAYATGRSFCINTAPSPSLEASHCSVISWLSSKYFKTGVLVIVSFSKSNYFWGFVVHYHWIFFFSKSLNILVCCDKLGKNLSDSWSFQEIAATVLH